MPEKIQLYAYLNIEHPMVAWEVAIGRIKSACDKNEEGFGISLWQYNLLKKYSTNGSSKNFTSELKLDLIRQQKFPNCVSRLSGLYFFESEKDANAALDRWKIPNRKKYISEVDFSATSITRADSEWITWNLLSENTDWMEKYWAGETCGQSPLNEFIASGIGIIRNIDLRNQAYKNIMGLWPTSTPLLAAACCAFVHAGMEEVAHIKPALINEDNRIVGSYYINMNDLNTRESEVAAAVQRCKECQEMPPVIMPENPEEFFNIPDFRASSFEFRDAESQILYQQVHES